MTVPFVPELTRVGPKGYIHGWIFVGAPGIGAKVTHPEHGHGVVTAAGGKHVTVKFGPAEHSFEHRPSAGTAAHLEPRPAGSPKAALRGDAAYGHVQSASELGAKEDAGVRDYTVASYLYNAPLRDGKKIASAFRRTQYRNIESAFTKAKPTASEIVAYRGGTASLFGRGNATGTEFTDKGFTSMTTDRGVGRQFASEGDEAILEIQVPPGSKVVKPGGSSYYTGANDEKELMLNAGGRFKVISDRTVGGVRRLTVMYLG